MNPAARLGLSTVAAVAVACGIGDGLIAYTASRWGDFR